MMGQLLCIPAIRLSLRRTHDLGVYHRRHPTRQGSHHRKVIRARGLNQKVTICGRHKFLQPASHFIKACRVRLKLGYVSVLTSGTKVRLQDANPDHLLVAVDSNPPRTPLSGGLVCDRHPFGKRELQSTSSFKARRSRYHTLIGERARHSSATLKSKRALKPRLHKLQDP